MFSVRPSVFRGRMPRLLLMCLLLSVLLGMAAASAAEERRLSPDGRFEYILQEDGTAVIADWIEDKEPIEVPQAVDGHPVTAIGSYAFQCLYHAETVHLPEGVTAIRDHAFSGFDMLKRTNLPSSVVSIGINPWVNCVDLTVFEIEGESPLFFLSEGCLYSSDHTLIACLEGLCPGDTVSVLSGTKIIGERAFFGGSGSICRVVLPEGVEEIRSSSLTSLEEVELPATVSFIGDGAFHGGEMTDFTLPDGVRSIGANPFDMCRRLTGIHISEQNPRYQVWDGALYDLDTHTLISWPLGLDRTDPVVREGTLAIGSLAFNRARIGRIRLPEGLQAIGAEAFSSCSQLTDISFPSSLQTIGGEAFANCYSLHVPVFPDGLREIGDYAFCFVSWQGPLVLPAGLSVLGADPFVGCSLPAGIEVSRQNDHFAVKDGFLYDTGECRLIKCFSGAEQVVIPDGIRRIGARAFWQNETMRRAVLPASVEAIDPFAFNECVSMESIVFSQGLTVVGPYAFADCIELTEVILPETLTLIDGGGFAFCPALKQVTLAGDRVFISPSAFFMTDANVMGPGGAAVGPLKKNLPLI